MTKWMIELVTELSCANAYRLGVASRDIEGEDYRRVYARMEEILSDPAIWPEVQRRYPGLYQGCEVDFAHLDPDGERKAAQRRLRGHRDAVNEVRCAQTLYHQAEERLRKAVSGADGAGVPMKELVHITGQHAGTLEAWMIMHRQDAEREAELDQARRQAGSR